MRITDRLPKLSESFPLLQLPLELRRRVYRHSIFYSRNPPLEDIYLKRLPDGRRDPPSPLLLVNSQVRAEVLDMVQIWPIGLRVTHQGIRFNSLAETCFIAQRCSRDYGSIPHLVFEIWPPHPDRPTDIIDIWRHLRQLRKELLSVPVLQRVSFAFAVNDMAAWTHNGRALGLLDSGGENPLAAENGDNDVTKIMDLFARVRVSTSKPPFYLPRGLTPGNKTTAHVRAWRRLTNAMMMGKIPFDEDTYSEESEKEAGVQDCIDDSREWYLQKKGAEIARDKLDAMTGHGQKPFRLSVREWEKFIAIWAPHFERLWPDEFKGMRYYVYVEDPYKSLLDDYYGPNRGNKLWELSV